MTKARNIAELANDISVDNNRDVTLSNLRSDQPMMFRNKIINGDMRIDQRNGGSSVTPTNSSPTDYTLDRWKFSVLQPSKLTCQQVSDAPAGFNKSIKVTSSSSYNPSSNDYFLVQQRIEGYNTSDLNWGTLNAKSITVSFWVKSSLTGTFSGAVRNSDGFGRGYVFEYTVGVADTWEYKSLSLVGDTEGTWATDNNKSIELGFSLGAGSDFYASAGAWNPTNDFATSGSNNLVQTSGATLNITGVQLEEGTVATPFEHRPYGTELALCQRYYATSIPQGYTISNFPTGADGAHMIAGGTNDLFGYIPFPVEMRARPTTYIYSSVNRAAGSIRRVTDGSDIAVSSYQPGTSNNKSLVYFNGLSGVSANQQFTFHYVAISEL